MNSKEIKFNIEVNIAGERFSLKVPLAKQDFVRKTEAEMEFCLKEFRERFPGKGQKELLAMMAYHYASNYFALAEQKEQEIEEAEELLREAERLINDPEMTDSGEDAEEIDPY
ncbi:MAG: cell division protein ZapA [Muribaculaceae bacterium]|nr:cell division protein ZapA [Muribaculaceae bacterium]